MQDKAFSLVVDTVKPMQNAVFNVNTNDLKSVKLLIKIVKAGTPIDLTGATVRVAIKKPDRKSVLQDGTVTNATGGKFEVVLDTQAYVISGNHEAEVMIYYGSDVVAVTSDFKYFAKKGIVDSSTVESTNEFQSITKAINDAQYLIEDLRTNGTGIDAEARSELWKKTDKSYVDTKIASVASGSPKGTYATVAALQTAFPTGNTNVYVVTADGKWYYWSGSAWTAGGVYLGTGMDIVPLEKLAFATTGKNLFDKSKATIDQSINPTTGNTTADTLFYASDYMEVLPNTDYKKTTTHTFAYYDQNKTFISGVSSGANLLTPANVKYVRVSVVKSAIDTFQLEKGTVSTIYEPYRFTIPSNLVEKQTITVSDVPVIPAEKIGIVKAGKNLFDPSAAVTGYYVNQSNGTIMEGASYTSSDFIAVTPNTQYTRSYDNRVAFYDANRVFISGHYDSSGTTKTITTPANAAFMRVTTLTASQLSNFQVELGSVQTSYEAYKKVIDPKYVEKPALTASDIPSLSLDKISSAIPGKNLFNKATVEIGKYINWTNGLAQANVTYNASDFMPVKPNTSYTRNVSLHYAWFTSSKTFISGANGGPTTLVSPANAAYFKQSVLPSDMDKFQFEEGTVFSGYEPFGFRIPNLIISSSAVAGTEEVMNIPSQIPAIVGQEFSLYFDNVMNKVKDHDINVITSEGEQKAKRYINTFSTSKTLALTLEKYKDYSLKKAKATSIVAKASSENTKNFVVCVIGDSTSDGSNKATKKMLDLFNADTYSDVTLIGTRGTAPDLTEGRSGWTANNYVTLATTGGVANAFWNPNTNAFDFAYYMAQNPTFAVPTHVFINLGINDTFGSTSDDSLATAMAAILPRYDIMINSIKAYNPVINIGVVLTIPPNASQDMFGTIYKADQTQWRYKRNNELWVNELIKKYDNRTGEGIYLIPANIVLDAETDHADGVHPNTTGYGKIGEMYYRFLKVFG